MALALQRTMGNAAVSRLIPEEEPVQEEAPVQRSGVESVLSSPGTPLAGPVRTDMEARLGADFSGVRVHTGPAARDSAARIGARAYTAGDHVVIGDGGADPHTLAHELTHVIQQRQGPVAGTDNGSGLSISDPSDRFEQEAEANAHRALSAPAPRRPAGAGSGTHTPGTAQGPSETVQRAPEDGTIGAAIHQAMVGSAEAIRALAGKVGTDEWNLVNALLDPAFDLRGAHEIAPEILEANLKDRISYASCYPTAEALFPILTGDSAGAAKHGRNPARCRDLHEFQGEVRSLIQAMHEAYSNGTVPTVFRIEFAGHGFTLVMRRGSGAPNGPLRFELIESLAHAAGIVESLFHGGHLFTAEQVNEAINCMASGEVERRVHGAGIFGWNAHALYLGDPQLTEAEHFPETRMRWWSNPLSAEAGDNWFQLFRERFNFVAHHYQSPGIQ